MGFSPFDSGEEDEHNGVGFVEIQCIYAAQDNLSDGAVP